MINRDDYVHYVTKNLHKTSSHHATGFSMPIPILKLLNLSLGDKISVLMARDMSHIVVEKAREENVGGLAKKVVK